MMLGNITTIGETKKKNDKKLLKYIYNFFFFNVVLCKRAELYQVVHVQTWLVKKNQKLELGLSL